MQSNIIYIVYETTNLINGKYYIGVHKQTGHEFDGYLGSGVVVNKAIKKYGSKNFLRETLHTFTNPEKAFKKEADIVTDAFISHKNTYNALVGGNGTIGNMKGFVTTKDRDGNYHYVSVDDPRYISGELVHSTKGNVVVKNAMGMTFSVPIDDPRYISGELVHINKGISNSGVKNSVLVVGKNGKKFRIKKDDPRYISGEVNSVLKGVPMNEDVKRKIRETKKNQPRLKCPYCDVTGIKCNMVRWHFDNCKHKA